MLFFLFLIYFLLRGLRFFSISKRFCIDLTTTVFSKKNDIKQNKIPEIRMGLPILLTLIPEDFIAVISLFFWRLPIVKIVDINMDIGSAILTNKGIVYI